jgi:hypothetical protein
MSPKSTIGRLSTMLTALGLAVSAAALAPQDRIPEAVQSLEAASGGTATVVMHRINGVAQIVRLAPGTVEVAGATAKARSLDFLARYGDLFGVTDPSRELEAAGTWLGRLGHTHLGFQQVYEGVPVYGGELRAHFDQGGQLLAMNGVFVPGISVDPAPTVSPEDAESLAKTLVAKQKTGGNTVDLRASDAALYVFRAGLGWGRPGRDHLVWEVEVIRGSGVHQILWIDAHRGSVIQQVSGIHTLHRVIDEGADGNTIWTEGDPLPYSGSGEDADPQINRIINTSKETYDLFLNLSGGTFVSWDANDGTMHSIYDPTDPDVDCPNAWWSPSTQTTNFCADMTDDDTIAHEWTHGYSSSTHGVGGFWQSGALNESFSDIFGETVDLLNNPAEDPDGPRLAGECSTFAQATLPIFNVLSPESVAGVIPVTDAEFNPAPPWTPPPTPASR